MSKSILQRRAEIQGLATAILLPSVGVFGGPAGSEVGEVGPLTSVVGIGLFQRTVLRRLDQAAPVCQVSLPPSMSVKAWLTAQGEIITLEENYELHPKLRLLKGAQIVTYRLAEKQEASKR